MVGAVWPGRHAEVRGKRPSATTLVVLSGTALQETHEVKLGDVVGIKERIAEELTVRETVAHDLSIDVLVACTFLPHAEHDLLPLDRLELVAVDELHVDVRTVDGLVERHHRAEVAHELAVLLVHGEPDVVVVRAPALDERLHEEVVLHVGEQVQRRRQADVVHERGRGGRRGLIRFRGRIRREQSERQPCRHECNLCLHFHLSLLFGEGTFLTF